MTIRLLRYVRHADLAAVLALGWRLVADFRGTHHGYYSAGLVAWDGPEPAPWIREAA